MICSGVNATEKQVEGHITVCNVSHGRVHSFDIGTIRHLFEQGIVQERN